MKFEWDQVKAESNLLTQIRDTNYIHYVAQVGADRSEAQQCIVENQ